MSSQTSLLTTIIFFVLLFNIPSAQALDIYEYRMLNDSSLFQTQTTVWAILNPTMTAEIVTCGSKEVFKINRPLTPTFYDVISLQLNGLPTHEEVYLAFTFYEFSSSQTPSYPSSLQVSTGTIPLNQYLLSTDTGFTKSDTCGSEFTFNTRIYGILRRSASTTLNLQIRHNFLAGVTAFGIRELVISLGKQVLGFGYYIDQTTPALVPGGSLLCSKASQYRDSTSNCRDCDESCAACYTGEYSQDPLIPGSKGCFECTELYGYDGTECVLCDDSCATCSGTASNQCTSCPSGSTLTSDHQCVSCDPSCATCSGPGQNQCTSCPSGLPPNFLSQCCDSSCATCSGPSSNQCTTCPYGSTLNGAHQCVDCDSSCGTCSGPGQSECTSCPSGLTLNSLSQCCDPSCTTCSGPTSNECTSCPHGSTLNALSECVACDPSCLTCSGLGQSECTSCPSGLPPNSLSQCCDPSCTTCSGPASNECTTCPFGKTLNGAHQCVVCDSSCLTCSGPGQSQCTSCLPGLPLNSLSQCCNPSCATCSGPASNECTTCPSGRTLTMSHQCVTCDSSCLTCSGSGQSLCTSCQSGLLLNSLSQCCNPSCATCSGPGSNQCTSCPHGSTLNGAHQCVPCDSSCKTCSGPGQNECTSCPSGLPPNFLSECCDPSCITCSGPASNECTSCPSGKTLDSNHQCVFCDPSCATCSGQALNQCTSCPTGKVLSIDNRCISPIRGSGSIYTGTEEGFFDTLLTPPSEQGTATFVTFSKFMQYVRQLPVKLPPRLNDMSASKGRPILSLRVQSSLENTIYSWFTRRSLATGPTLQKQILHERFLANFGGDIFVIGIIFACGLLFTFLKFLADRLKYPTTAIILDKFKTLTKWNLGLMLFGLYIDDIILFSATEFRTIQFDSPSANLSFAMSVIIDIIVITFLASTVLLVRKAAKLKKEAEVTQDNSKYEAFIYKWRSFQLYFRGFNEKPFLNQLFFILYISRAALPMFLATVLQSVPVAQTVFQMLISVVIVSYGILLKPLRKKINHYQMVIIESLVLLLNICVLALVAMANSGVSDTPGCIFLGDTIIIGNVIINVITVVILLIKMVIVLKEIRAVSKVSKKQAAISCIHLLVPPLQQIGLGFEELLGDIPVPSQGKQESREIVMATRVSKVSVIPLPKSSNFNAAKKTAVDDTMDQPSAERLGQSSSRLLIGSHAMNQSQIINQSQAFNQSQGMVDWNDLSINEASVEIGSTRNKQRQKIDSRVTDMKSQGSTTIFRGNVLKQEVDDSTKPYIVEKRVQGGYIGTRSNYETTDERRRRTTAVSGSQSDGYKQRL